MWLKEVAPSPELRKWFGHDPAKWEQFQKRYWIELEEEKEAVQLLKQKVKQGTVTLVYAARDEGHNGALALKRFLDCLLYTSPSPRDRTRSRMPSSA